MKKRMKKRIVSRKTFIFEAIHIKYKREGEKLIWHIK